MQIRLDPDRSSYDSLLSWFWYNVDPTQANGQICDYGNQYPTVIFTHNEKQEIVAKTRRTRTGQEIGKRIETQIMKAGKFYPGRRISPELLQEEFSQ
ncbi:MAG TPA: hypothetical protein DEF45_00830 [Rhodopirellula sp.]|nr:MAG: hypothetical protein CBD74_03910 [Saprospirales bacterium TMED214]HBV61543.1 hypothetical protein [Rhodopirellula sp.]